MRIFSNETRSFGMRAFSGALLMMLVQFAWSQPAGWNTALPILVTENSGAALSGYQLRLQIDTASLIGTGKMNADGSDLLFGADEQGNTLLPYYLESGINTASTVVWVRLATLPASGSIIIWMFSGNPAASSASSVTGTFDYVDQYTNSATNQVNSGSPGGVGNSQRGFRFSPTQDILVFQFGKDEPTGTTRYVTLFDFSSQAVLAQTQVSGPAAQYSYANLPQPIWLTQGTQYLLELYQDTSDGYYFGSSSQINPLLTYYDMRYCNGCTQNTFPTNTLSNYQYGYPDFEFATRQQVTPAPTYLVGPGATTTTLLGDSPSTIYTQPVVFTATVNGLFNPSGTVAFYDGATLVAGCANPATLNAASPPVATCTTSSLGVGAHNITAHYTGDAGNVASTSGPLAHQVTPYTTLTTLSSECMLAYTSGQPFTFSATVTGLSPTGRVTFFNGGNVMPCAARLLINGSASCTTSSLTALGNNDTTYDLTAAYSGDADNAPSVSAALHVTVLDPAGVVFRSNFEDIPLSCPVE